MNKIAAKFCLGLFKPKQAAGRSPTATGSAVGAEREARPGESRDRCPAGLIELRESIVGTLREARTAREQAEWEEKYALEELLTVVTDALAVSLLTMNRIISEAPADNR